MRSSQVLVLTASLLVIMSLTVDVHAADGQKYAMNVNESAVLDCSSLGNDVEFYWRKAGAQGQFNRIELPAEPKNDSSQVPAPLPHYSIKNGNLLEFNRLNFVDLDRVYMCKSSKDANKTLTFDSHPHFGHDDSYKPQMNVLSSSFRLLLSFKPMNANCTWQFSRPVAAIADNSSLSSPDVNKLVNSTKYIVHSDRLEILQPNSSDSGIYFCQLNNVHGHTYKKVEVVVKSDLMALLPFLIVLAQVLLCSALFFIWEKRCSGGDSSNEYSFEHAYNKNRQDPLA